MHQTHAIAGYVEKTKDMSAAERKQMWADAVKYNKKLARRPWSLDLNDEEEKVYTHTLDVTDTGIMGYVDIPQYKIALPIYHGTDQGTLQIAIGHLEGTSLPVGGASTHCVISGHTGLPSARLFTDIDKMKIGDHFMLRVLGKTLTYEVDQIDTVLPDQLDDLRIEKGKDLCTLVTCTPYGINTHRLLVRGHRVPNDPAPGTAVKETPYLLYAAIAAVVLAVLAYIIWRKRKKQKQVSGTSSITNNQKDS